MKTIFNFCPKCKSDKISTENGHKHCCYTCQFEYYHNVASAVMVILQHNNEILFTIRNENPKINLLDLPGGFVDYNETAIQTVERELLEELNISLTDTEINYFNSYPNQYLFKDILYHTLDLAFIIKIDKKLVTKFEKNEIKGLVWLNLEDVDFNKLAFESTKKFVSAYIEKPL